MSKKDALDQQVIKRLLSYDQDTGVFINLVARGPVRAGSQAGSVSRNGYVKIGVGGHVYLAHRLAWFYVHGKWPSELIDHINGDKLDNRITNLRDVHRVVNGQNRRGTLLGASWKKRDKRWVAAIRVHGKYIYLGQFMDAESAHAAYVKAKRQLHEGCTI